MPARREDHRLAPIPVAVESGSTRTFVCALDWPGWCRSGRDEASALQALLDSAPRYARVFARTTLGFRSPDALSAFRVVERLKGNATTDFGAPGVPAQAEAGPVSDSQLARMRVSLRAGWRAFDAAVDVARGRRLRKGPRGGGRDLDAIVRHVRDAEAGYLLGLGWPFKGSERADTRDELERTRKAVLEGLAASARGEIPAEGPRGGRRWKARFFVRRLAWHTLDHLWEIEDRLE